MTVDVERYSRQILFEKIGEEGQEKLARGSALVVGCGALGAAAASLLVRAGVGAVRLVDRDVVEASNLHRQILFDEADAAARLPKAEAAARHLRAMNAACRIEAFTVDVTPRNVERLVAGVGVVVDGLDNFEARYLVNDACVSAGVPWVYGGVLGAVGVTMTILPGDGPCLRCVFPEPPAPGTLPTCDTQGVIGPAPVAIGALEAVEACKVLMGSGEVRRELAYLDVWEGSLRTVRVARSPSCPACGERRFEFLSAKAHSTAAALCGRNSVQITPATEAAIPLERLAQELARAGSVSFNGFVLEFRAEGYELLLFPDGRAIVKGTSEADVARGVYARYVGS
ncbi:MAG: ThiF family adenylyltransferase [Deltaproteobacteria bacterium]|nr:ThiF family adenylyltransferase [Deltaproteobacteria bacterium]